MHSNTSAYRCALARLRRFPVPVMHSHSACNGPVFTNAGELALCRKHRVLHIMVACRCAHAAVLQVPKPAGTTQRGLAKARWALVGFRP
eukprot:2592280-Alexandrium_andersonii.AAC.1